MCSVRHAFGFSVLAALALLGSVAHAQSYTVRYEASTGSLPEVSCPAWALNGTGNAASISSGVLTISGGTQSHLLSYSLPVAFASPVVVEFRARRLNGTTSSPAREQLGIGIGTETNVGVHFFVGPDVVFLTNGTNSRGPEAIVDTDAMHVYRVEVSGSSVKVFYDGVETLTGNTFSSTDFPVPGIAWGDITNAADGASEWEYVQHNSSAQPCQRYTVRYEASTGFLPEVSCPTWVLSKTGNTASITGSVLTISGGTQSHVLSYSLPVALANPVVVEFRARRLSGTTSSPAREQLGISIGTSTNAGVHFFVGPDVIFITNGTNSRGPQAFVDTDAMHVYRVEVSGSSVKVFYDGVETLTGNTFSSTDFPVPGIAWGDFTNFADGASEWEYVQHNSSAQTGGTLSIGDVITYEGNTGATLFDVPVRLSGPCSAPVSMVWKTADATATAANADFVPDSTSLTLVPGATSGTITVSVNGDVTPENHETFLVNLLNPVNAAIVDAQGSAMILNDDTVTAAEGAPLLKLSMAIQGNPAGGVVSFRLGLPEAGKVELSIFDVAGRLVAQPIKSVLSAGYHTVPWDTRRAVGPLPSGVYFARFQAQDRTLRRRFVLVR